MIFEARENAWTSQSERTVTVVCNAWRNITLATPQLWNSFTIRLHPLKPASIQNLTETYLKRSGTLPLAIQIEMHRNEELSKPPYAMFYPIFDRLNAHSHRWDTLVLRIPFSLSTRLTGSPSSAAPRLDSLTIRTTGSSSGPRSSVGFGSHQTQFRPSEVTMSGLYLKAIQIDWSHVKEVDVESLSIDECLQLLCQAPLLKEFSIGNILGDSASTQLQVTHHSLQTWSSTSFETPFSLLCDQLILPKLENLTISDGPSDALERLLKRSSCPLVYFGLCDSDTSGLISLLRAMPHLKHFCFEDLVSSDDEITSLCALLASTATFPADSGESTLFLPRLETVEYYKCPTPLWATVPSWFPPTETQPGMRHRPLSDIYIDVWISPSKMEDKAIDTNTVPKLLDLIDRGFILKVDNYYNSDRKEKPEVNFIEASRRYHDRRGVGPS